MARTTNQMPIFENEIDLLLSELCREWGFCNQLTAIDLIADGQDLSADDFAVAVLLAEQMNPESEITWRRRIAEKFSVKVSPRSLRS